MASRLRSKFFPRSLRCAADQEQRKVILLFPGAPGAATLLEVARLACCIIDPACYSRSFIPLRGGLRKQTVSECF